MDLESSVRGGSRGELFAARVRELLPSPRPHPSTWEPSSGRVRKASLAQSTRMIWNGSSRLARAGALTPLLGVTVLHPVLAVAPIVAGIVAAGARRVDVATADDLALLEDLPEIPQTLVRLTIFHPHAVGSDRGVLWLDGDVLCFLGSRSSFMIGLQDTVEESPSKSRHGWRRIRLYGTLQAAWMEIRELKSTAGAGFGAGLDGVLDAFRALERPTDATRLWPPLTRGVNV